jgi:hypothetical protein
LLQELGYSKDVVDLIKSSVNTERSQLPSFFSQVAIKEGLDEQISTPHTLEEHISRLNFPKISILFPQLKNDLLSIREASPPSLLTSEVVVAEKRRSSFGENDFDTKLAEFFHEFNHSTKGKVYLSWFDCV